MTLHCQAQQLDGRTVRVHQHAASHACKLPAASNVVLSYQGSLMYGKLRSVSGGMLQIVQEHCTIHFPLQI